ISPEWVESELLAQKGILQAAVFGEARPALSAVLVAPGLSDASLQHAVNIANKKLPDYAQVKYWVRATDPFGSHNGLATSNGRNKRDAIEEAYYKAIDNLYDDEEETT
ncbi:MAG TPA: long-chain acyl-CoA synthetase, partial [Pseudomonadales bacterium]|nr:long-chain acyl-CoA synthetase [Pseudomonadales bacterium]